MCVSVCVSDAKGSFSADSEPGAFVSPEGRAVGTWPSLHPKTDWARETSLATLTLVFCNLIKKKKMTFSDLLLIIPPN